MPYQFTYSDGDGTHFTCPLQCRTCDYITTRGTECARKVCVGLPFCWQHTKKQYNVYIGNSTIPQAGKGLFYYDKSSPKGARILSAQRTLFQYSGELISDDILDQRYGTGIPPYSVEHKDEDKSVDASCIRGVASLINHKSRANCHFGFDRATGQVIVRTTRALINGEELFINYRTNMTFPANVRFKTKQGRL